MLKVKKAAMTFIKEPVGSTSTPGYRHAVEWQGIYSMRAAPLLARNGAPRYISGTMDGIIYVGKSTENKFNDGDLPRGFWDRPGMSNTYYEFNIDPSRPIWVP